MCPPLTIIMQLKSEVLITLHFLAMFSLLYSITNEEHFRSASAINLATTNDFHYKHHEQTTTNLHFTLKAKLNGTQRNTQVST